jgi:hypothetical protein
MPQTNVARSLRSLGDFFALALDTLLQMPRRPFACDSGIGREGGIFSREFFTEPKAVVVAIEAANGQ